ncbi:hypothetical protein BH10PLA2_BH10PLA2_37240 [soil metagenome]
MSDLKRWAFDIITPQFRCENDSETMKPGNVAKDRSLQRALTEFSKPEQLGEFKSQMQANLPRIHL